MSSLTIPSIEAGAGSFWSRWCSSLRNIWQIKNGSGFWGFWELMAAPAAGVRYTCRGQWGGEFGGRDLEPVLKDVRLEKGQGVLMEVLGEMLSENGLELPMEGLFAREPQRALELLKK